MSFYSMSMCTHAGVPIKHNHRVEFPMAMDLKEHCEAGSPAADGCHYSLRGALVHLGASANQVFR